MTLENTPPLSAAGAVGTATTSAADTSVSSATSFFMLTTVLRGSAALHAERTPATRGSPTRALDGLSAACERAFAMITNSGVTSEHLRVLSGEEKMMVYPTKVTE